MRHLRHMRHIRADETGRINRKSILASCLLLALVVLVAACGGASNAPQSGLAATTTTTTTTTATDTSTTVATMAALTPTATPLPQRPTATPTPKPPSSSTVTVDITGTSTFSFSPRKITIKAGTKVKWVNETNIIHTSTSTSGPRGWDSGIINVGGAFTFTFTVPGTYTYDCMIHPYMTATVVVTG